MSNRLAEILSNKRKEISGLEINSLRKVAENSPAPRDFLKAVRREAGQAVRLIAELKKASPSRGVLAADLDLKAVARVYAENGAAAISVLTDQKFFLGELETLRSLRFEEKVAIPLLRKDFIIDAAQVYEARANGADAILLIAAALPDDAVMSDLHALAMNLGLTALVEVHNEEELKRVLGIAELKLVGINNRDLSTFEISLDTTEKLRPLIPAGISVVAESGIFGLQELKRMQAAQVDAVLVGEALVTAADIARKVRELSSRGDEND
jgi:indole-3-glycerol phosphate synthase